MGAAFKWAVCHHWSVACDDTQGIKYNKRMQEDIDVICKELDSVQEDNYMFAVTEEGKGVYRGREELFLKYLGKKVKLHMEMFCLILEELGFKETIITEEGMFQLKMSFDVGLCLNDDWSRLLGDCLYIQMSKDNMSVGYPAALWKDYLLLGIVTGKLIFN